MSRRGLLIAGLVVALLALVGPASAVEDPKGSFESKGFVTAHISLDNVEVETILPTSSADEMHQTVLRLLELNHRILCPGHDY